MAGTDAKLTLGPLLYHWERPDFRDFYFRIADEAPIDRVYFGEVVCPKRQPLNVHDYDAVLDRLASAGKEVVMAAPILVAENRDRLALEDALAMGNLVEANDMTTVAAADAAARSFAVGPYVNVYSAATLEWLAGRGAVHATLPFELPRGSLKAIASVARVPLEVQVYGRWPLAISARCYHARAYGRTKDACQFACGHDPDGLDVATLDGEDFLAVNGVQTMSHRYGLLAAEVPDLRAMGIGWFRLSPQRADMVRVAGVFRDLLDGTKEPAAAVDALAALSPRPFSNGFFHGAEGAAWQALPGRAVRAP